MGTDPHLENNNPAISCLLSNEKFIKSPRHTKGPDNSNVLQMFNNNAYTDFRTADKNILNPS